MDNPEANLKTFIRDFISKNFFINNTSIIFSDQDSFTEKGIIDSTGVLEIVQFIQSTYGLTLSDSEIIPENLDSIEKISLFIKRKMDIAS
jgi:acyl carrier protein